MKKTTIEVPIWNFDITIIVGGNVKDILREATRRKFGKEMIDEIITDNIQSSDRGACYFCKVQCEAIMWYSSHKIDSSTIMHESLRLVDWLSDYLGFPKEMEARAYTQEYLVKVIRKTLKTLSP